MWWCHFSTFGHLNERKFAQWQTKLAKAGPKFCQIVNKSPKIAQDFKDFAKVAKFRHIWSHWMSHTRNIFASTSKGSKLSNFWQGERERERGCPKIKTQQSKKNISYVLLTQSAQQGINSFYVNFFFCYLATTVLASKPVFMIFNAWAMSDPLLLLLLLHRSSFYNSIEFESESKNSIWNTKNETFLAWIFVLDNEKLFSRSFQMIASQFLCETL